VITRLLLGWATSALALAVADWVLPGLRFHGLAPLLFAAAVFGIANATLKPVLTILALPLILLTLGLAYLFVNVFILAFTAWVVEGMTIHGLPTYVGAVVVVWLTNLVTQSMLSKQKQR
jgi:putative membrane protein